MSSEVEQIKDRLNIVDVIGQYVTLQRAGRNFRARCPFHKEHTPSFMVSSERGTYMCFGCGEKGDIFSFLQKIDGIDFRTALEELAKKAGVTLHQESARKVENKEKGERLRDVCEAAAVFFLSKLNERKDVEEYLRTRGVTDETRGSWRLGYAPASWRELSEHLVSAGFSKDEAVEAGLSVRSQRKEGEVHDRFRGRVMFPMNDAQGRVIAFSGRFFENVAGFREEGVPAKYVNSPETTLFKKSRTLYGFDRAKTAIRKADCILLVEGQFDLILAHQSGLPFTVALSGTALTPEHLSLLGRLSKRLVLALDADAAGVRSGLKSAAMAFAAGFDVKIPTFPAGKDPADIAKESPELLKQSIRTSQTAVDFFLEALRPGLHDERSYKKAVEALVLPLISVMHSKIEQEYFIRIVANRLLVSESAVREEVAKKKMTASVDVYKRAEEAAIQPWQGMSIDLIERKAAMLLFYFTQDSEMHTRLQVLLGHERVVEIIERLGAEAEEWRYKFEAELGEHTSEEIIATDILSDIERLVEKQRFKMKFL